MERRSQLHIENLALRSFTRTMADPPDSSREFPGQAEDSAWPALLRTIQSMAIVLSYPSAKIYIQVEILSSVAIFVTGIDKRINHLNSLIKRAQEATNELAPR
ncbi:hypothetical protein NDU88_011218 [Pleurodeles waltl]|uniref:Uncharacterized protein n=1 Tax=Pleurodeles waltl TaxID=8319 RepID=A0AAV7Q0N8_PLEWA|nr:hypothetical protein NDU88_011218 [Pleurodeles waltl]